jgi:hypothetical protein
MEVERPGDGSHFEEDRLMKRLKSAALALLLAMPLLAGCAAYTMSPATGFLYTDLKAPLTATSHDTSSKMGTSIGSSILGLVATGDASIETAMKNGGITRVHHVDYHSKSILGIYATFTTIVYGE